MGLKERFSALKSFFTGRPLNEDVATRVNEIFRKVVASFEEGDINGLYEGLDLLQKVFGYKKLPVDDQLSTSYVDLMTQNTYNWYQSLLHRSMDRVARYQDYDLMDEYPDVCTALDMYAEDATQIDKVKGETIWVESSNSKIESVVDRLFRRMDLENKIYGMARMLAKYGDLFGRQIFAEKLSLGVQAVQYIDPKYVARVHDPYGRLRGFKIGLAVAQESKAKGSDDEPPLKPWHVVHYKVPGRSLFADYGDSLLLAARPIWVQLKLMEDAMVIYRLVRANDRLIYYIDVGCITGDTKICLLDGRNVRIDELANNYKPGDVLYVYSCDENGKVQIGKATNPRCTGEKEIYEVYLDNGEVVRCTDNHPFLMKDGSYKRADELQPGDSLMPIYFKWDKQWHEQVRTCFGQWRYTHVMSYAMANGKYDNEGKVIHHKDFNSLNNLPENLVLVDYDEHDRIHQNAINTASLPIRERWIAYNVSRKRWYDLKRKWKNGDYNTEARYKANLFNLKKARNPVSIAKQAASCSKTMKRLYSSPYYRAEDRREFSIRTSERNKINWKNPEYRKFMGEVLSRNGKKVVEYLNSDLEIYWKRCYSNCLRYGWSMEEAKARADYLTDRRYLLQNHKVVKVVRTGLKEKVYDITVEKYHNFAIQQGIFLHNSAGADEAMRIVQQWKRMLKRKQFIDPQTGKFESRYNPLSSIDDLYWPIRPGSNSRVERLPGSQNISDIADVEYFRNKLYGALRIPKAYFAADTSLDIYGKNLAQQDIRYARTVKRLQRGLITGLRRQIDIELACLGIDPRLPENDYVVRMAAISNLDDALYVEAMAEKIDAAVKLVELGATLQLDMNEWRKYVLEEIIGLDPELLNRVIKAPWTSIISPPADTSEPGEAPAKVAAALDREVPEWRLMLDDIKQGLALLMESRGITLNGKRLSEMEELPNESEI